MSNRVLPIGFIPPCLPTKAATPPSGALWLHEIKHDGFRVIARKDGTKVRLYSRPGNDLTYRFPLIAETVAGLPWRTESALASAFIIWPRSATNMRFIAASVTACVAISCRRISRFWTCRHRVTTQMIPMKGASASQ